MRCPSCKNDDDHVTNSGVSLDGKEFIRRRHCRGCGHRWTTREIHASRLQGPMPARKRQAIPTSKLMACCGKIVPDTPGVYFVAVGAAVKIGCAKHLQSRLQDLQVGSPERLEVIGYRLTATAPDARVLERQLHRQYADLRVRGEWFQRVPVVESLGSLPTTNSAG